MNSVVRNVLDMFRRWFIAPDKIGTKPTDWSFEYSSGALLTSSATGLWEFFFPLSGSVNYLTTLYKQSRTPKLIMLKFEVASTPGTVYHSMEAPPPAANLRLYFQQRWDNLSGAGKFASYRWWAAADSYTLGDSDGKEVIFSVPLNTGRWSNVQGQMGTDAPDDFTKALANIGRIGLTFGGGCAFGHGVNVPTGSAKFVLKSVEIQ